jgi:aldose sugar dehydrogenase
VGAQSGPAVVDPNLGVRTVVSGLVTPSTMAFLGPNDFLVLEKATGAVQGTVLDLSVNNASERGLLGIALHPDFPNDPGVYLYWTCRSTAPLDADPFRPEEQACSDDPAAMFGQPDTDDILRVPLLGNRVDRFEWTGSALVFDANLKKLLAFQHDGARSLRARVIPPSPRGGTTTAARSHSARTESSTSPRATSAAAGRRRTCRRGRLRRPRTTSSAAPRRTTPT